MAKTNTKKFPVITSWLNGDIGRLAGGQSIGGFRSAPDNWSAGQSFESIDQLAGVFSEYLSERENLDGLIADRQAAIDEKTRLISEGRREATGRLVEIESRVSALDSLIGPAEDRATRSEQVYLFILSEGWRVLVQAAAAARDRAISAKSREILELPPVARAQVAGKVAFARSVAEANLPGLSRLAIVPSWPSGDMNLLAEKFALVEAVNRDPSILEQE